MSARPVEALLGRLEGVRKAGKGWAARCPAHQDRTASLSVAEGDDGRALLHCHAGCPAAAVAAAAGLEVADLFPERQRIGSHMTREERRAVTAESRTARQWSALNACLPHLAVVEAAAGHVASGGSLTAEDARRVAEAHQCVHDVRAGIARGIPA